MRVLESLFGFITIPRGVYDEVSGRRPLPQGGWIKIVNLAARSRYSLLRADLDHGESEAIALCLEQPTDLLIVDDAEARKTATGLGIAIMGTGGILVLAKRKGLIPSVREALQHLDRDGAFRLSSSVRDMLLREADE